MATTNKYFKVKNGLDVNSNATVDASGNANIAGNLTANTGFISADTIRLDTSFVTGSSQTAELAWNPDDGTIEFAMKDGDVVHRIGQQMVIRVVNNTGSSITEGSVVYISGSSGQQPRIALANAATEGGSTKTFGFVTQNGGIANGADGYVCTAGIMRGVDVGAYTAGTALWLANVAGTFTSTKPVAPDNGVFLGWVIKEGNSGSILVHVQNGYELDELHNVLIDGTPADNEILAWDSTSSLWKNQTASEAGLAALSGATFTGNIAGTNINLSSNLSASSILTTYLTSGSINVYNPNVGNLTIVANAISASSNNVPSDLWLQLDGGNTFTSGNITAATLIGNTNASTITTGTINNSRTTANSANGSSTIIARDVNGSFAANVVAAKAISVSGVITSSIVTGTAPFSVLSTTEVANLTAQFATTANAVAVGNVTGLGTNVSAFLATPSSSNLLNAITDETGIGKLVFSNGPTFDKAQGSAPFIVSSTTEVTNLTAQYVTNGVYTTTTSLPNVTSVNSTTIPNGATLLTTSSTLDASKLNTNTVVTLNATNVAATNVNATTVLVSGDANVAGKLSVTYKSGDEGGEIFLSNAATNTSITNGVTIDVYQNKLRFFEQGGSARGYYIDITAGAGGAGTALTGGGGGGSGTVTSIATTSPITGGTITSTGTIGINSSSTNTVNYVVQRDGSGNFAANIITANVSGNITGGTYNALSLTSSATGFTIAGGTTSKTLTVSNTIAIAGTDASTLNIGSGGTLGTAAFTASSAYEPAITTLATSKGGTGLSSFTSGGAVYATSTSALTTGTLPLTAGGTGGTTAQAARTNLVAPRVWTSTSQPADGDSNVGDIWIDTDSTPPGNITVARFEASKTTSQSTSDGTTATMTYDSTIENTGGYSISSGLVTVPFTGRYSVTAQLNWAQQGGTRRIVRIQKNGTTVWENYANSTSTVGGFGMLVSAYSERFNAGDTVSIAGRQDSGGSLSITDGRLVVEYLGV